MFGFFVILSASTKSLGPSGFKHAAPAHNVIAMSTRTHSAFGVSPRRRRFHHSMARPTVITPSQARPSTTDECAFAHATNKAGNPAKATHLGIEVGVVAARRMTNRSK